MRLWPGQVNKIQLFLIIGLLSIGQSVFCGPDELDLSGSSRQQFDSWNDPRVAFDTCWENDFFRRELRTIENLEINYFPALAKQGHVPLIGSLPNKGSKSLALLSSWLVARYAQLAPKASKNNKDHVRHLAEVRMLQRKLDRYLWRYSGALAFVGDHPKLVITSAVLLGTCILALLPSKPAPPIRRSLWQRFWNSFGL